MRYIEIILKLAFILLAGIVLFKPESFVCVFLVISFLLGITLIFNKKSSYNYPQTKRDLVIRRIEGVLLVMFAIVATIIICKP